jgi:hypothetical protein
MYYASTETCTMPEPTSSLSPTTIATFQYSCDGSKAAVDLAVLRRGLWHHHCCAIAIIGIAFSERSENFGVKQIPTSNRKLEKSCRGNGVETGTLAMINGYCNRDYNCRWGERRFFETLWSPLETLFNSNHSSIAQASISF